MSGLSHMRLCPKNKWYYIIMFRQDVITWHFDFQSDSISYNFKNSNRRGRRGGNMWQILYEPHSPPGLHHFNH